MNVRDALVIFVIGSVPVSLAFVSGCSAGDFQVAADAGSDHAADTGQAPPDTATLDTGSPVFDAPIEAAPCAPIELGSNTIYVDQRATRAAIGTVDCPVKTIKEAIAIVGTLTSGKHTIKVAGGVTGMPLVYDESAALVLKAGTTLSGDGPGRVVITGGGVCSGTPCIVVMEGNSVLDGVRIDAKGARVPLAINAGAFTGVTVAHTSITGAKGMTIPGIFITGSGIVDLGPEISVTNNEGVGVIVESIFSMHVIASSGSIPNRFDNNLAGIVMKGGALSFDGGEAVGNATSGIDVRSTSGNVNINGLDAHGNGAVGVRVDGGASLRIRGSSLVNNGRFGVLFKFAGGNDLDLGKPGDTGKNTLGGATSNNKVGGVCLSSSHGSSTEARGIKWSTCPPSQDNYDTSCDAVTTYADVWYPGSGSGSAPFNVSDCTVGP